jgi:hypothetical protein
VPEVDLSDELYARLEGFKPLLEAVLGEHASLDFCTEVVLIRGLDVMLSDLMENVEPQVLLASFQGLAAQHPEAIYGYVVEMMNTGDAINREKARRRIGAAPPHDA